MKYFFSFIFVISCTALFAQEITIKDGITKQPVAQVVVSAPNNKISVASDRYGKFSFKLFSPKDTLLFRHIAYEDFRCTLKDLENKNEVFLNPATISKDGITVTSGKTDKNSSSFKEELIPQKTDKMNYFSLGDYLKNQSSLYVKDYGGDGGSKTVSSRGMSSENTVVLFNEARVNDLRSGIFDFSTVDINSIDKVVYLKSFDYETPFSSPGGVVKIYTDQKENLTKANYWMKFNSDLLKSFGADFSSGFGAYLYRVTAERSWSPNRYKYTFENNEHERENAWLSKTFLSGELYHTTDNFHFKFYSNYSFLNSGIPGYVATNNLASSRATNKTISTLNVFNSEYNFSGSLSLEANINYNYQSLLIDDPDGLIFYSNEKKKSELNELSIPLKLKYNGNSWNINAGYEFSSSSLSNITTLISASGIVDDIKRNVHRVFAGAKKTFHAPVSFISNIQLTALIANENLTEKLPDEVKSQSASYKAGLTVFPSFTSSLILKANFGDDYRLPTFNERYYSMLYSHYDLKNEKYQWYDAGFDFYFNLFGQTQLSASYFNIKGKNKIIWIPTRVAIQIPRNVANFQSQGLELFIAKNIIDSTIRFTGTYNYTDSRNKTKTSEQDLSYDKFIMYTPLHRLNLNLAVNYSMLSFSVSSSFVSERFYSSDNVYKLDPYFVLDASAGVNFNIAGKKNTLSFTVYNITKEEYFIIQSYPMPLTTFLLTYYLEII